MAQDVGGPQAVPEDPQLGPDDPQLEPDGSQDEDERRRSSIWPWILLAIVTLIIIILLWLYWRRPSQGDVTVIRKEAEISVEVTSPEAPVVPVATSTATIEESRSAGWGSTGTSGRTNPAVNYVTMPSVKGLTRSSAESRIKAAGLVPYIMYGRTGKTPVGSVVSQWPPGGESVPQGSEGFIQIQLGAE
jgi:hypothetical protein